jgi:hypothetical protein
MATWLLWSAGILIVAGAWYAFKTYDEVVAMRKELANLSAFMEKIADTQGWRTRRGG